MSVKKLGRATLADDDPLPIWKVEDSRFSKLTLYLSSPKERQAYLRELENLRREDRRSVKNRLIRKIEETSKTKVVPVGSGSYGESQYCLYKDIVYKFDRVGYSEEEMTLQIMELEDKERQKFERLRHKFSLAQREECKGTKRELIPEPVRIAVWRRDGGRCARCGSRERLEYDHIIPLSRGLVLK